MATYAELYALKTGTGINDLRTRIRMAVSIKANAVAKDGAATAPAKEWARNALGNPEASEATLLNYILAEYNAQTTSVIVNATDAQVQAAVDAAVSALLGA